MTKTKGFLKQSWEESFSLNAFAVEDHAVGQAHILYEDTKLVLAMPGSHHELEEWTETL